MDPEIATYQLEGLWEHRKHVEAVRDGIDIKNEETRERLQARLDYVDEQMDKVRQHLTTTTESV